MAERRPTMMDPPVEHLLEKVDSKFTLVTLAAMRGRQINSYFNQLPAYLDGLVGGDAPAHPEDDTGPRQAGTCLGY